MTLSSALRASVAATVALLGCGYRPLGAPPAWRSESVRVLLPETARVGEPELARSLQVELVRRLASAGARASSAGAAHATLSSRVLALETTDSPLDPTGRRVAARSLRLRLAVRLAGSDDRTLWRSGLIEIEELWSLSPGGAVSSEVSRRRTLQRLAARAAEEIVELIEAGMR